MRLQMSKAALKKMRRKEREAEQQSKGDTDSQMDLPVAMGSAGNGEGSSIPPQQPAFIIAMAAPAPEPVIRIVDSPPPPIFAPSPPPAAVTVPVFLPPQGTAGELLAMLMPSSTQANANGHSVSSSTSAMHPLPVPSRGVTDQHPPSSSSYFKSKSGFSIRL
jgi:hypothetical protein